ncbi:hypothetical protein BDY24DRAFT_16358 [Mrakia frigida]|uniref:DsbA family protein n=1 Tax=Mrakia frigida TaxID=29902 RepID=UPI003FCC226A
MSGSLRPSLSFQRQGSPSSEHTLDLFVDFQCPKSALITKSIQDNLIPLISPGGKLDGKLAIVFRSAPQNWHISSAYLAETAFAVGRLTGSSAAFWQTVLVLFENQSNFFNVRASGLSATQIREEAASLVSASFKGGDASVSSADILKLTTNQGAPNGPTTVTEDLQYNVKFARQLSIQHTPSLALDGIVQGHNFDGGIVNGISSSWGAPEWTAWLKDVVRV